MGVEATDLELMLARLHALWVELDTIEEPAPNDRSKPYPPASEDEIRAAEKRLNFTFPPVYRTFLALHNGWRNFSYDWSIFGVSGPFYERTVKNWATSSAQFEKRLARKGPETARTIRENSKTDPGLIYWPDHVPVAIDFNGGFRIYDRNRPSGEGEFEIAEINARSEEAANREPGFLAIIDLAFHIARRELRSHGRNPETIERAATIEQLRAAVAGTSRPARPPKASPASRKNTGSPRTTRTAGAKRKMAKPKRTARVAVRKKKNGKKQPSRRRK